MDSENNGSTDSTVRLTGLILLSVVVIAVQVIVGFIIYCNLPDWTNRGQFGDMFGAVNTLFSGLAFAGVIYAIFLQRNELELQRDELRLTRTELNRPVVTVRVQSHSEPGNVGAGLDILVENSGTRPAKNIQLSVESQALESAFDGNPDDALKAAVRKVFTDKGIIPILANGQTVTNGFGFLSANDQTTWKSDQRLNVQVSHEDLNDIKYRYSIPILIATNAGFAGSNWKDSSNHN